MGCVGTLPRYKVGCRLEQLCRLMSAPGMMLMQQQDRRFVLVPGKRRVDDCNQKRERVKVQ